MQLLFVSTDHCKGNKHKRKLQFDPRLPEDKSFSEQSYITSIQELTKIFPENSLRHLWCISPQAPEAAIEIEIATITACMSCANNYC